MNAVAQLSLIIIFKKLRVEQMSCVPSKIALRTTSGTCTTGWELLL